MSHDVGMVQCCPESHQGAAVVSNDSEAFMPQRLHHADQMDGDQ